ncbi:energy-coupling factor transporter transmembrane protein EcfT [Thermoflexus sp.]|uniref:energy-coupling factor transporter transmembrane component T family protein n=1 Tax=Thermoflexus sp. TaxID=1969742 RepID=UPI0025FD486A|nr:energy-coupling factor transporter transmembrane component T [Thermoflexus sp.]MCS7350060.1 energy-coupling factor transporter transmembrane protein EcfT [Thermoflexus sp.]MCX7689424.1 energy-coupling factor transporter transmembrane protein EcfT [Thermoflexus sp.]MDW8179509.1 energy-coupling factor transporter transmembrane component T [Anaerolineae bacterium]
MNVPFRYIQRQTIVHRLHPFTKMIYVLLTLLLILIPLYDIRHLPVLLIWLGLSAALWAAARIEVGRFAALLKILAGTFIFLMLAQGFTYRHGKTVLIKFGDLHFGGSNVGELTLEGVQLGFMLSVRILTAASSLPLLVMTTSNAELMAAMNQLRLPKVMTFMFVSALSFTSLIFEMWNNIVDAQKLRAFDIDRMDPITRLRRAYVPIITPLILLLFRKANDFQIALETKGFGSPGRPTEIQTLQMKPIDFLAIGIFVAVFILCNLLRFRL